MYNINYNEKRNEIGETDQVELPVLFHNMLERPEEVFLEPEVGEFALLDEFSGQLSQRVHGEERDLLPRATSYPVEVVTENLPDSGPLKPDASHVIIRDFDDFCERKHARLCGMRQLLEGNLTTKHILLCEFIA